MASGAGIWGIEIGQCELKAVKLRSGSDNVVEVAAFDVVPHEKVLAQADANREELIAGTLKKFVERSNPGGEQFVIGVPGQQTFARFCKLPPAQPKQLPALVRYEAEQQIPFAMEDVVWDYQKFEDPDSPDVEVGIFAMRKDLIQKHLDYFAPVRIRPLSVQAVPAALYNFARYEYEDQLGDGALVVIDVGTQNTDLIIVESNRAWTRTIPLGGNAFTETLVKNFKLSFAKAEELKRNAASHKYARQIFQAMRPVFADLVAEISRSIGFYSSTHRDVELKQVLAVGNAFRLTGLQKYIENNLSIPGGVTKLEELQRIRIGAEVDAAKFNDQLLNLAGTVGLALQGIGEGKITADLLPPDLARLAIWKRKQWWFVGAAAAMGLAAAIPFLKNTMDLGVVERSDPTAEQEIQRAIQTAQGFENRFRQVSSESTVSEGDVEKYKSLVDKKRVIAAIIAAVHQALPEPDPRLAAVQSPEELRKLIQSAPAQYARNQRKTLTIESFDLKYVADLDAVPLSTGGGYTGFAQAPETPVATEGGGDNPGFVVRIDATSPFGTTEADLTQFLVEEYYPRLREFVNRPGMGVHVPLPPEDDASKDYVDRAPQLTRGFRGGGGGGGFPGGPGGATGAVSAVDPVTGESTIGDWSIEFGLKFKIGDAPPPPETPADETNTG